MKTFVVCFLLLYVEVTNAQSLSFRAGQSFPSTAYLSLRYEHWTNGPINLSLGAFYERSRKDLLNHSSFGLDLLAEYASNREGYSNGAFGLRYGFGVTGDLNNDPWVYKDWSFKRRLNYGLLAEGAGEWFMTDNFTLRLGLQQKLLFNPDLGHYRFLAALGLVWRLGDY